MFLSLKIVAFDMSSILKHDEWKNYIPLDRGGRGMMTTQPVKGRHVAATTAPMIGWEIYYNKIMFSLWPVLLITRPLVSDHYGNNNM